MATKQIATTVRDVRLGDIFELRIRPTEDGTDVEMEAIYDVIVDGTGDRHKRDSFVLTLGSAAKTALVNYVNTNVLPVINTKEGIV